MKRLAALLLLCGLHVSANAQQEMPNNAHQFTSPPAGARYEIVMSQWLRRQTFRLDRFSGRVWVRVAPSATESAQGDLWESIPVEGKNSYTASNNPHFQVILSGLMAKDAFLIDNNSGEIWQLVKTSKKGADGKDEDDWFLWEKMRIVD